MMNLSKKFSTLIVVFCLALSFVGCDEFEVTFPYEGDLESIALSESSKGSTTSLIVTETEDIKDILTSIKSDSKKTNKDSVGETPLNIEDYIELDFLYPEDNGKVAEVNYIYKLKNKYYIEQPYVGIWNITKESYDKINALINQ